MLRKATEHHDIIVEQFRNINEFVNVTKKRNRVHNLGERFEVDFNGFNRFEDACEMLASGYSEPVKEVMASIAKIDRKKTVEQKRKPRRFESVEGYAPIVPNALRGLPNSMMNQRMTSKKTKVLNVLVDGSYTASTSESEIRNHYSKVIAYLMSLEKQGFRIRLSMMMNFGRPEVREDHLMTLMLKDEKQPFDIKKLMFPMVHRGFFRTIGFEWYMRLPESIHLSGFGIPLYRFGNEQREEILNCVFGDVGKYYYIKYGDNVEDVMRGAK